MARSWRRCAAETCEAEAIYGAFCIACQSRTDPGHMTFIDWGDDLDE